MLASGLAVLCLSISVEASLIGSSVTGSMLVNNMPPNYFDPAFGFVPSTGYLNSAGTTVMVSASAVEFGYSDSKNLDTADFGAATLTLTDVSNGGSVPITYKFVDPAFAGLTLSTLSNNFPTGSTAALAGTTLTLTTPMFIGTSGTFSAVFSLAAATAVPEPAPLAMTLGTLAFGALLIRRRS
jgi:hypothetical protein